MAEAESAFLATPVIYPLFRNGRKQVVGATFAQELEFFDYDGHRPVGWPVTLDQAIFHASPVLYDFDEDGDNDVILSTRCVCSFPSSFCAATVC